jgi:hypothetical protein
VTQFGIAATFVAFFQNQYSPIDADMECTNVLIEHIDALLTADLDLALLAPFFGEEIRTASKAGGTNRAPDWMGSAWASTGLRGTLSGMIGMHM